MEMWFQEDSDDERGQIIADLKEALDEIISTPLGPEERPYF